MLEECMMLLHDITMQVHIPDQLHWQLWFQWGIHSMWCVLDAHEPLASQLYYNFRLNLTQRCFLEGVYICVETSSKAKYVNFSLGYHSWWFSSFVCLSIDWLRLFLFSNSVCFCCKPGCFPLAHLVQVGYPFWC